jgi:hypothetical protein
LKEHAEADPEDDEFKKLKEDSIKVFKQALSTDKKIISAN